MERWAIQMHYTNADGAGNPEVLVLMNMYDGPVNYTLPGGRTWTRVDTQPCFDLPGARVSPPDGLMKPVADALASANITWDARRFRDYTVQPRSIVVMVQQAGG